MRLVVALVCLLCLPLARAAALSPSDRALLERITYGASAADVAEMERLGRDRYLRARLAYQGDAALPPEARAAIAKLPVTRYDIHRLAEISAEFRQTVQKLPENERRAAIRALREKYGEPAMESAERRAIRALHSTNQLQEMMTWFWFNHFNVFEGKGPVRFLVPDYEEQAIRPHVLGKFPDLVKATLMHPAMLVYLDNARNRSGRINENYARELLELHTVGVEGGYTQADVQALAHLLTGATANLGDRPVPRAAGAYAKGAFIFLPRQHDASAQVLLGRHIESSTGFERIERVAEMLARHPSTARFISRKLAVYFYGDQPPEALIARTAAAFSASDGDIARTLYALFTAPEFGRPLPQKFKDPVQYVYSSVRLAYPGAVFANHRPVVTAIAGLGEGAYARQTPDGYGLLERDWASPDQMEKRFQFARMLPVAQARLYSPPPVDESPADRAMMAASFRQARAAHPLDLGWARTLVATRYAERSRAAADAAPNETEWLTLVLSAPDFMYR